MKRVKIDGPLFPRQKVNKILTTNYYSGKRHRLLNLFWDKCYALIEKIPTEYHITHLDTDGNYHTEEVTEDTIKYIQVISVVEFSSLIKIRYIDHTGKPKTQTMTPAEIIAIEGIPITKDYFLEVSNLYTNLFSVHKTNK
jgi:hypothetical protein